MDKSFQRDRLSQYYEVFVGLAGIIAAIFYLSRLHPHSLLIAILMISMATALEAIPVPLGRATGSLMIALPVSAMVVYGGPEAVGMSVAAMLVGPIVQRRWTQWSTWLFNGGQYALSTLAMVGVYSLIYSTGVHALVDWVIVAGVLAGVATHLLVNHTFVNLVYAFRGVFNRADARQLLVDDGTITLIALPLAFLMVLLGPRHPLLGPVIILPIVLFGHLLRMYRQTAAIQQVHVTMSRLASEFDLDKLCEAAAETAAQLTYADAVAVFVLNEANKTLYPNVILPVEAAVNFSVDGYSEQNGGVIWSVIRSNDWVYVPNALKDERAKFEGTEEVIYQSMAIFPMAYRGDIQGALVCYSVRPRAFSSESTKYIRTLSSQLAVLLENAKLYQTLQQQSVRDGATGLYNYRFFYEELARRVKRGAVSGEDLSVAVVDVDYFKKFNDTYGHLAGDAVLRSMGALLAKLAGPDAVVARYGGEEFGIIFPYDAQTTLERLELIRAEVSHFVVEFDGYHLQGITVSSGVASFPEHAATDRDLLLKADSAMYWGAKQRGRNRTALYHPEFEAQLFVDELTGLYTYHFINIRAREEFQGGGSSWGVVCIDLNQFSHVNTTFGFEVGDRILKETSLLIKECLRHNELACRIGGDEFLVLLPNVTVMELDAIARRIEKMIATHKYVCGTSVVLPMRANVVTRSFDNVEDTTDLFDGIGQVFAEMHQVEGESLA